MTIPWLPMAALADWFLEVDQVDPPFRMDRGQPDLRPDGALFETGAKEIGEGSLSYCRLLPQLALAVQADLLRTRGFVPGSAAIVVTAGIVGGLSCIFRSLLKPGDRVLVPSPIWPAIPEIIHRSGGIPSPYPFRNSGDAERLPELLAQLCTPRTRMIVINSPSNPSGVLMPQETVSVLLQCARELGLLVVWDDAYESLMPTTTSPRLLNASLTHADEALLLCSMSKRFGAPALRVGIIRAPLRYEGQLWDEVLLQCGGVSRICQAGATDLLRNGASFELELQEAITARRRHLIEVLGADRIVNGEGTAGLYVLMRVPKGTEGWMFSRAALAQGVGIVPGECFGSPCTVRISLTVDVSRMSDVSERLERAWKSLDY